MPVPGGNAEDELELFTIPQLVSLMQVSGFDTVTAELVRELVTIAIREEVGPVVFDALDAAGRRPFKPIALAVAKRLAQNPEGLRSRARQIDDYSETDTYAAETLADGALTEAEKARIAAILGRSAGAFTIRQRAEPFRSPWVARR
jgi:hypothetical protein